MLLKKWHGWFWDHACRVTYLNIICSLSWLEVRDCNGNWYEGGQGCCLSEMGVADKMTLSVLRWGALQLIAQKAH